MTVAVVVLVWCVCAGFAALIAHGKARSVGGFALAGLLLGPIGLLWAAFAHPAASARSQRRELARQRRDRLSRPAHSSDWRRHLPG